MLLCTKTYKEQGPSRDVQLDTETSNGNYSRNGRNDPSVRRYPLGNAVSVHHLYGDDREPGSDQVGAWVVSIAIVNSRPM
jgi:hypothetical protein